MRNILISVLAAASLSMPLTAVSANRCEFVFKTSPATLVNLPGRVHTYAENLQVHVANESGFLKKIEILEKAKPGGTVDLAYFIYENDFSASYLSQKLMQQAEAKNLKVRILTDYFMAEKFKETLGMLDANPRIEVKLFRPPSPKLFSLLKDKLQLPRPEFFLEGLSQLKPEKILQALQESRYVMTKMFGVKKLIAELQQGEAQGVTIDSTALIQRLTKEIAVSDVGLALSFRQEFTIFTKRLHHKLMLVETDKGLDFINGGRNISDEYNVSYGHPFLANRNYPFFDAEVSGHVDGKDMVAMQKKFR